MMVQANVVWLAFDAGILKVQEGIPLAEFPEIEYYPNTELSRKIGSCIRAMLNGFFGPNESSFTSGYWPAYFWNRGLVIEECEFGE